MKDINKIIMMFIYVDLSIRSSLGLYLLSYDVSIYYHLSISKANMISNLIFLVYYIMGLYLFKTSKTLELIDNSRQ